MRGKFVASFLLFIIFIQVFSLVSWVSIASNYFYSTEIAWSFPVAEMVDDMDEEGVKMSNLNDITFHHSFHYVNRVQMNNELLYLHYSEDLKEGFFKILYSPPNSI
jgi:hypothetical protein